MYVLNNMIGALKPGGVVLDLQVIRPNPLVEVDGRVVCEINGEPLFRKADTATVAVDTLVAAGRLSEQFVDDHDVLEHYKNGADLVDDFADTTRRLPDRAVPGLRATTRRCTVRERCRLRRLQLR